MVYKKLWLVVLAVFLCLVASCNGLNSYGSKGGQRRKAWDFVNWIEELPFHVRIIIGTAINATFFVIVYTSVRWCCPTCCSKIRPGMILNFTDIDVPEVQPLTVSHSKRTTVVEMK